jgi:hypothetical protein
MLVKIIPKTKYRLHIHPPLPCPFYEGEQMNMLIFIHLCLFSL